MGSAGGERLMFPTQRLYLGNSINYKDIRDHSGQEASGQEQGPFKQYDVLGKSGAGAGELEQYSNITKKVIDDIGGAVDISRCGDGYRYAENEATDPDK